jgi:hypothetical protein
VKRWRKVRGVALRGWVKCADGRLYHRVVAEKALTAWIDKLAQRKASDAGNAKRWKTVSDEPAIVAALVLAADMLTRINPQAAVLRAAKVRKNRVPPGVPPGREDGPTGSPTRTSDHIPEHSQQNEKRTDLSVSSLRSDTAEAAETADEWSDPDRKALFAGGVAWLAKATERDRKAVKTIVGRWLKLTGDDAAAVLKQVRAARDGSVIDPVAWIEKSLQAPAASAADAAPDWAARAKYFKHSGWRDEWGDRAAVPAEFAEQFTEQRGAA